MARSLATGRTAATNRVVVQDMKASLSFNRFSTTVTATTGIALAQPTMSFGGWFKPTKSVNDWILYYGFATSESAVILVKPDGRVYVKFLNIAGGAKEFYVAGGSYTVKYQQWNHIVVTYDGANIKVYTDGILNHTLAATGNINLSNTVFTSGSTTSFGLEKDSFLYSDALTATEVSGLYNGSFPTDNQTLRWKLDEGAGTIAYDTSGNGNHGTITAGTFVADVPSKKRGVVGGNMVYNGDFEYAPPTNIAATTDNSTWVDGTLLGSTSNKLFGVYTQGNGMSLAMFDSSISSSGLKSIKLSTVFAAQWRQVLFSCNSVNGISNNIPCLPNTAYIVTFNMKTNYISGDSNGVRLFVKELSGSLGVVTSTASPLVKTTTDWTKYSIAFTTSATTRYINLIGNLTGDYGTATLIMDAWFDDIDLRPTTPGARSLAS